MLPPVLLGVVLSTLLSQVTSDPGVNVTRIVGGVVTPTYIPYMVALYVDGSFECGGALITRDCVITAAHCVQGNSASSFIVRAGIVTLGGGGGVRTTVRRTFVPGPFSMQSVNYDVAILKLRNSLTGYNIKPIQLNTVPLEVGQRLKVSGWGTTSESSDAVSNQLRYVFVPAVNRRQCNTEYPGEITRTMFCAGYPNGGRDACAGDSGGPAVRSRRLYGITSWGNGCARANQAGVYTSIRKVLPWVQRIKNQYCTRGN